MKDENIGHLRRKFGPVYDNSIHDIPDGWAGIIGDFLQFLEDLGDLTDAVSCRYERTPSGLKAFVFPEMSRWHPEQLHALQAAQRTLYGLSQQTCETCGKPAIYPPTARFLCIEHDAAVQRDLAELEAITAELEAILPYKHLRDFDLGIPVLLRELIYSTLRQINQIVESEDLIGRVFVIKIEVSENQLFLNVRYDRDFPAAIRSNIDDLIKHAERQSDEIARGGSHAS